MFWILFLYVRSIYIKYEQCRYKIIAATREMIEIKKNTIIEILFSLIRPANKHKCRKYREEYQIGMDFDDMAKKKICTLTRKIHKLYSKFIDHAQQIRTHIENINILSPYSNN